MILKSYDTSVDPKHDFQDPIGLGACPPASVLHRSRSVSGREKVWIQSVLLLAPSSSVWHQSRSVSGRARQRPAGAAPRAPYLSYCRRLLHRSCIEIEMIRYEVGKASERVWRVISEDVWKSTGKGLGDVKMVSRWIWPKSS